MSIGQTLARARQDAGLSVTQISQQTRIRETVIRGIEHDDFTPCGGGFYARGHIRSVAAMVGADADLLIQEYDTAHGGTRQASATGTPGPDVPLRLPRRRRVNWSTAIGLVIAAVVICGGALADKQVLPGSPRGQSSATKSPSNQPAPLSCAWYWRAPSWDR